jgi:hypothetical protein
MSPVALFGAAGLLYTASPVVMVVQNRSPEPLTLSASLWKEKPLWQGTLAPGRAGHGAGKIRSDTHILVRCRSGGGPDLVHEFGYLTHGYDERVTITVKACDDIRYDQQDLMLP